LEGIRPDTLRFTLEGMVSATFPGDDEGFQVHALASGHRGEVGWFCRDGAVREVL